MIEKIRSLIWADYLLYTLINTRQAGQLLNRSECFIKSTLVLPLIYAFFSIISSSLIHEQSTFFFHKIGYGSFFIIGTTLLQVFIIAMSIGFILQLFKVEVKLPVIFSIINLSYLPKLFILPWALFWSSANFATGPMYLAGIILFWGLSSITVIKLLIHTHDVSPLKATLSLFLPLIIFPVLFLLLIYDLFLLIINALI